MRPSPPPPLRSPSLCLLALLACAAAAPPALADEVLTLSGEVRAQVLGLEGAGAAARLLTDRGPLEAATVREIRFDGTMTIDRPRPVRVYLRNGDEIPGTLAATEAEAVAMVSPTLGALKLPLDAVAAVLFSADAAVAERFGAEVMPGDPAGDFVVLSSWQRRGGALESIGPDGVAIDLEAVGSVTLGPDKILGVRLAPLVAAPAAPAGLAARLELGCGGHVSGALRGLTTDAVALETSYHPSLQVARPNVLALSFGGGRFVYLSDLEPAETETRSQVIQIVFPPRRDQAVMGGPLRLERRTYRKGLGVKAYTRLAYPLEGGYRTLRAIVGVDDTARARTDLDGTVRFQVLVDGRKALGEEGLLLSARDGARPIEVSLAGARRVELVTDFGPSGDVLARGAWADAFLAR